MNYYDIPAEKLQQIKTLGELKATGYQPKAVKEELRDNLISKLKNNEQVFEGIWGYEDYVIPQEERAIHARNNNKQ